MEAPVAVCTNNQWNNCRGGVHLCVALGSYLCTEHHARVHTTHEANDVGRYDQYLCYRRDEDEEIVLRETHADNLRTLAGLAGKGPTRDRLNQEADSLDPPCRVQEDDGAIAIPPLTPDEETVLRFIRSDGGYRDYASEELHPAFFGEDDELVRGMDNRVLAIINQLQTKGLITVILRENGFHLVHSLITARDRRSAAVLKSAPTLNPVPA